MTQYNSLNVKLSNSQLNELKSAIKNETEVVLRLSSNIIGDNETNFPHKLLLTDRQVSSLRKSFANNSSGDIKLSKSQLSKMIQSGGFLSRLLGPLLKTGLPLIKNVIKPLWNEMEDIIEIVQALEDSGLLLKGVTETVQNEVKEQKRGFLSMVLGALGASLLGNLLTGKGIYRAGKGKGINRAGEGIVRAGYGNNKMDF